MRGKLKDARKRLRRPTYAELVATLALFIALGGASYAAIQIPKNSVGTKQLKNRAVTAKKIHKNAVNTWKVRNGSLLAKDFKAGQLPAGATGPTGPVGLPGATGPAGLQGPTGPEGLIGPPGLQGVTGPEGPAGVTGAAGEIGPTGEQGPAGETGPGATAVVTGRSSAPDGEPWFYFPSGVSEPTQDLDKVAAISPPVTVYLSDFTVRASTPPGFDGSNPRHRWFDFGVNDSDQLIHCVMSGAEQTCINDSKVVAIPPTSEFFIFSSGYGTGPPAADLTFSYILSPQPPGS